MTDPDHPTDGVASGTPVPAPAGAPSEDPVAVTAAPDTLAVAVVGAADGAPDAPAWGSGSAHPPKGSTGADPDPGTPRTSRAGRRRKRSTNRLIVEWLVLILGALLIAVVIKTFVFQAFWIPTESMVPTLNVDDRVLVNKLSYTVGDPERGDIVVFDAPPGERTAEIKDLVKRIVGLPGEVVAVTDGEVTINGRALVEPYVKRENTRTSPACRVPADSYFMMGDNRNVSADSRFFGPVKRSTIVGRVFLRIWPLGDLSLLGDGPSWKPGSSSTTAAQAGSSDASVPFCAGTVANSATTPTSLATASE